MKILWITNIVFPEALGILNGENSALKGTGGWMLGASKALLESGNVVLNVVSPSEQVSSLKVINGEDITYYLFPNKVNNHKYNASLESIFRRINEMVNPDIVHIHGTEFSHGLAYVRACGTDRVVASIQGMSSMYSKFKTSGLSTWSLIKHLSPSDIIMKQSLFHKVKNLRVSGQSEIKLIKELKHVIGRTLWDKANTWAINPEINYYFCNEILRPEFYSGAWSYNECNRHTILFNQPTNSTKGFHQLLKALPLVIKRYPDTIVYLSGIKGLDADTLKQKVVETGYVKYLRRIINKYGLRKHLIYLGPLNAEQMKIQYLKSNVFVSASAIENSPNSVGEAQILGVPCISSYVGGIADMIDNGKTGLLYRFEETNMLAYFICKVFSGEIDCKMMSRNERRAAELRHAPNVNTERLKQIYNEILQNGKIE